MLLYGPRKLPKDFAKKEEPADANTKKEATEEKMETWATLHGWKNQLYFFISIILLSGNMYRTFNITSTYSTYVLLSALI